MVVKKIRRQSDEEPIPNKGLFIMFVSRCLNPVVMLFVWLVIGNSASIVCAA